MGQTLKNLAMLTGIVALGWLYVLHLGGHRSEPAPPVETSAPAEEASQPEPEVGEATYHGAFLLRNYRTGGNEYSRWVEGEVENVSPQDWQLVTVTAGLYDDSGAKVGTAIDHIQGLRAGQVWKFRARILEDRCTRCEIEDIKGL